MRAPALPLSVALLCSCDAEPLPLGPAESLALDAGAPKRGSEGPTQEDGGTADLGSSEDGSPGPDGGTGGASDPCADHPTRHGLAWSSAATEGVWCEGFFSEGTWCLDGCCSGVNARCIEVSASCSIADYCDGPEDCGAGQVCCLESRRSAGNNYIGAACRESCEGPEQEVCHDEGDCGGGGSCVRGWSNLGYADRGVCQSRAPSLCSETTPERCEGEDLSDTDLTGLQLRGANLKGANLQGVYGTSLDLSRADLSGACLREARFYGVSMEGADLRGVVIDSRTLLPSRLTGAVLDGVDFSRRSIHNSHLDGASLRGAILRDVSLRATRFNGADLTGANFLGARMLDVDFTGALTDGATFEGGEEYSGVICPDGSPAPFSTDRLRCDGHWGR